MSMSRRAASWPASYRTSSRSTCAAAADRFPPPARSDIEILHELRVLFDEYAPRLDVVAHERLEDLVGEHRLFDSDLEQRAALRIHRRVPELVGIHLAESLVALHVQAAASVAVAQASRDLVALLFVVRVVLFLAFRHAIERRLRDVDVAGLDELRHLP